MGVIIYNYNDEIVLISFRISFNMTRRKTMLLCTSKGDTIAFDYFSSPYLAYLKINLLIIYTLGERHMLIFSLIYIDAHVI